MPDGSIRFLGVLRALAARDVDFVLVGGVAAVLRGAPLITMDIDIVHSRAEGNVVRLGQALADLGAYYREHPDRKPGPELELMRGTGHHLFATREGPLDALGEIVGGMKYEELLEKSDLFELEPGLTVRVLRLRDLIRIKEMLGRDKDKAVLPILRQAMESDESNP